MYRQLVQVVSSVGTQQARMRISAVATWQVTQNVLHITQYTSANNIVARCPKGGDIYITPGTNTIAQCTPGLQQACPSNYECQASPITIQGVESTLGYCCSKPSKKPKICSKQYHKAYLYSIHAWTADLIFTPLTTSQVIEPVIEC